MEGSGTTSRAGESTSVKYRQQRRGRSSTLAKARARARETHLAIVPSHIRIGQHLREHGAHRQRAVRRSAIPGEAEALAQEDEVGGGLLGRGEREELADLERGAAERARVLREDVVFEQPFCLRYCGLQERSIGRARGERVRVLGVVLRARISENKRRRENITRRAWGIFCGSVSSGGYTLCYESWIRTLNGFRKKGNTGCMRAHKDRIRNDGLRLSRSCGWVVVVGIVPLSRECSRRSVGRGPIGQRGSTSSQCGRSTEQKPENASHIDAPKIPRVRAGERVSGNSTALKEYK